MGSRWIIFEPQAVKGGKKSPSLGQVRVNKPRVQRAAAPALKQLRQQRVPYTAICISIPAGAEWPARCLPSTRVCSIWIGVVADTERTTPCLFFPLAVVSGYCEMVIDFRPERRRVRQIRLTPSQYFLVVLISAKCPSSPWQQRALARPGSDSGDAPSLKRDTLRASRLCRGQLMRSRVSKSATKSARKANTKETGRTSN